MLAKTYGSAVYGVDAATITIEVNVGGEGKMNYVVVGLPDNAVREAIPRIETAVKQSGLRMPRARVVFNLSPADVRKEGTAYDLPMAIGTLASSGQIQNLDLLKDYIIMG
jgi:magnesium chelatase family protein